MNACTEHVILDQLMGPPNPIPPVASVSPKKRFLKTKSILMMIIIDQLELLVALSVAKDVKINFMQVGIWFPTVIQPPPDVGDDDDYYDVDVNDGDDDGER